MSGLLLRYFYLQSQWRRQEQAELRARIESLQARIRPHFLFNSLNSIAALVASDPVKAEQAVLDLSDLFRASLARPGTLVAWRDELELSRRYLPSNSIAWAIVYRWTGRSTVYRTICRFRSSRCNRCWRMRWSMAFSHVSRGVISVTADYVGGVFQLVVSNPFDESAQTQASRGTRQGLQNIDARLAALFGPLASLSVERREGRHYTCLRYPCARQTQEARSI